MAKSIPNPLGVRGGAIPSQNSLEYRITTADINRYLQRKIDVKIAAANQQDGGHRTPCKINIITQVAYGKRFHPFCALMSLDVLAKNNKRKKKNNNELAIFSPNECNQAISLKQEYYDVISPFMFNDVDRKAFNEPKTMRELQLNRKLIPQLVMFTKPKSIPVGKGSSKTDQVVVMLDPVRIFYDYLKPSEESSLEEKFRVRILEIKKLQDKNYRYTVERVNGGYDDNKKGKKKRKHKEPDIVEAMGQYAVRNR